MGHEDDIDGATFSNTETRVLTWSMHEHCARIWDADSGKCITSLEHGGTLWGAVFFEDGDRVLTWGGDETQGFARIWGTETGELLTPEMHHPCRVLKSSLSRDGARILTACYLLYNER